jgi:hypothetical protein
MASFLRSTSAALLLGTIACLSPLTLTKPASAQSDPPACPPPASQEFLLLVRGRNEAERADIASILPIESSVLICRYLDEVLVRAGGFTSLETVNAWASYMTSEANYESFVLRPTDRPATASSEAVAASESDTSADQQALDMASATTVPANVVFDPIRLASGYAVLVDYGSSPEIAATVSQLVPSVGLAVYQQRPYLLAAYSEDEASASAVLQQLNGAQLAAVIVDAQDVVRLAESVAVSAN